MPAVRLDSLPGLSCAHRRARCHALENALAATHRVTLRINTNVISLGAQRRLGETTRALERSYARLASGLRITVAADDAAGLAISERMGAELRSLKVARRNVLDGQSAMQIAEGALVELGDIVSRVRELAMRAASGTLSDVDRGALDAELEELTEEAERVVNAAKFNGLSLFDPNTVGEDGITLQVGPGEDETIRLDVPVVERAALALRTLDLTTSDGGRRAIGVLDVALEIVSDARGQLGAIQRRLETAGRVLAVREENLAAARSRIVDVDYALETAEVVRLEILQQAGVSMLSQANVQPELALALLSPPAQAV